MATAGIVLGWIGIAVLLLVALGSLGEAATLAFDEKVAILKTLGIIVLIVGAVLWILGSMGRPVGGRRHYW